MAQDDATRDDEVHDTNVVAPVRIHAEAAVAGSGMTSTDYGAPAGVNESQAVASDFTGSIESEPTHDPSGDPGPGGTE
jgi:hypothetical protein